MFALPRLSESVPEAPPTSAPNVPEYESDEPIVAVVVATDDTDPLLTTYANCPVVHGAVVLSAFVAPVLLIVIGADPNATNCEHVTDPVHETVVVAVDETSPLDPMYIAPCVSDGRKKLPDCVDEAVEKNPLSSPSVVDVEL